MDAVRTHQDEHGKPPMAGDFYVINSRYDTYYVSGDTARNVGRVLDRRWRPRWVRFVDLNGGRVWLRAASIESISESTELQRSRDREFNYLRRKEERADRRWDDDENW